VSRRALWPPSAGADPAALEATPHSPTAEHAGAHGASGGVLPGRSGGVLPVGTAVAAQVKLARLADLLAEAAQIFRELGEVPLAVAREPALMSSVNPARLLTAEDLAARMQVDARTIRRWRKAGKIPAGVEISGVVRWRPEEIERWLA